jgi:hypothetical protein
MGEDREGIGEAGARRIDRILKEAIDHPEMTEWETDFVNDMVIRLGKYGKDLFVSAKQHDILDRIEGKL